MRLDRAGARAVIDERRLSEPVDADWARPRAMGMNRARAVVAGDSVVIGAKPYQTLSDLIEQARTHSGPGAAPAAD